MCLRMCSASRRVRAEEGALMIDLLVCAAMLKQVAGRGEP